ncbi:hypothetical protein C7212DRAFT_202097 [Tuber magnatum]|uniref:Uncharacterized protein n=1 Tax=Tuber magnatum TaxID=42249 RepID=A0A317SRU8_9PEZI|nr:hypothetical protein C7212DRAFT_202097 [Tuber magnatum]
MEKNGELDSSFMAVDPVSPESNNSKDLLDEPAAPRRNSIDDNDPTRPRKRLAAMAIHDDMKDAEVVVESPREASSPLQDRASQLALGDCHSGEEEDRNNQRDEEGAVAPATGGVGKPITIHLRSSVQHQSEENQAQDDYASDRVNGSAQSTIQQSEQLQPLDSPRAASPNESIPTPDVEVEEVEEMDEGEDHLSSHITIVNNYLNNPVNTGGPGRVKDLMDSMVSKLERGKRYLNYDPTELRTFFVLEGLTHSIRSVSYAGIGRNIVLRVEFCQCRE